MNLYVYDLATHSHQQLTHFNEFDIKFPSMGKNSIVFEYSGYIFRFDLATNKYQKVPIFIREDMLGGRTSLINVAGDINQYTISPDGKRALMGARGDIFSVPAKYGVIRNLTKTSGVHERSGIWSPDGKWIAYISDSSGEDEIYLLPQADHNSPIQITKEAQTYKYELSWSPDSQKLLWLIDDYVCVTWILQLRKLKKWLRALPGKYIIMPGHRTVYG